jgi:hypothetical protein
MRAWNRTFKEAFCEHFSCPSEIYELEALRRFCYPHTRPLVGVLCRLKVRSIVGAVIFLHRAGPTQSYQDLLNEFVNYHFWLTAHRTLPSRLLRFQIPIRRLLRVCNEFIPAVTSGNPITRSTVQDQRCADAMHDHNEFSGIIEMEAGAIARSTMPGARGSFFRSRTLLGG